MLIKSNDKSYLQQSMNQNTFLGMNCLSLMNVAQKNDNNNNEICKYINDSNENSLLQRTSNLFSIFQGDYQENQNIIYDNSQLNFSYCHSYNLVSFTSNETSKNENNPFLLSKKNPFTTEEDELLIELVKTHGVGNWQKISIKMKEYNFSRNGRQCRDRYYHYLDPRINKVSDWSSEDDFLILKFVQENGKKWKEMEKIFPGRTEVSIRNRYNLLIRKEKKNKRKAEKCKKSIENAFLEKSDKNDLSNKSDDYPDISCNSKKTSENEKSELYSNLFDNSIFDSLFDETYSAPNNFDEYIYQ